MTIGTLAVCGILMVSPLYGAIPLIPPIAHSFNASRSNVGLIGFAFGFAYALACLLFGPLSDVTGRRR
jgi:YNFM family putative membrane transporter